MSYYAFYGFLYVPSWISLCPIYLGSLDFTSFLAPCNQVGNQVSNQVSNQAINQEKRASL